MTDLKRPAGTALRPKQPRPVRSSRAMYGAELRHHRERAGLSQPALAEMLFVHTSLIAKIESGARRISSEMAPELDRLLTTDGFFTRNLDAGRATPHREDVADAAELEGDALTVKEWEPLLVPGLLQTEAYALAVIRGHDPVLAEDEVRERMAARLERARLLDAPRPPLYWAVVNEAAIRCVVGGRAAMAEQLCQVAALVRASRIVFQVLPFSAGAHPAMNGGLRLMTFENDTPVAYRSGAGWGSLTDDPATVERHTLTYDLLAAAALSPEASLRLIEAAAADVGGDAGADPR